MYEHVNNNQVNPENHIGTIAFHGRKWYNNIISIGSI